VQEQTGAHYKVTKPMNPDKVGYVKQERESKASQKMG